LTQINTEITLKWIMGIEPISQRREQIMLLAARYGASHVRVFGSFARGTADDRSDVDFLVDLAPGRSLFDLGGLLYELQQLLGRNVDVVTPAGLRPRIRDRVLSEAIAL
jgi:predicted nucleotidyltransferase